MAEPRIERRDPDTVLEWCLKREGRDELVDGIPRAMTGALAVHNTVTFIARVALARRLGASRCQTFSDAIAIRIPTGRIRRPDITVYGGPEDGRKTIASEPVLVVEVLNETTRREDPSFKALEYKLVPSIRYLLFVEPEDDVVTLYARLEGGGWAVREFVGASTIIDLPALGPSIRLGEFYQESL